MGLDEALDALLDPDCGACGARLPRPGEQCPVCGCLPAGATRAEAAEVLSEPGRLAQAEAEQIRGEAEELMRRAEARLRDADRVVHVAGLEAARDEATRRLRAAVRERDAAAAAVKHAAQVEARARAGRAEAHNTRREYALAVERAERCRRDTREIVEARTRLTVAGQVLAERDAALTAATAAREGAERALQVAEQETGGYARDRDRAAAAASNPGRVPMSAETIQALARPIARLATLAWLTGEGAAAGESLTSEECALVTAMTAALASTTGVLAAERIKARNAARDQVLEDVQRRPQRAGDVVLAPPRRGITR